MAIKDFNLKEEFFNNFSYDEIKDSTTNSINRCYLLKYISYLIENNISFNLISFDIDKLKLFNSDNGHLNGDLLINKLIDIILPLLPENSIIGKLDGDEITFVIKGEYSYDEKWSLLRSIHQETRKPIIINDKSYLITLTSGLVSYPENSNNLEELLKLLDKALYRGKSKGGNCYIIYSNTRHKDLTLKPEITMIEKINKIKNVFNNSKKKELLDNSLFVIRDLLNIDGAIFFSKNDVSHANNIIMTLDNIDIDVINQEYNDDIIKVNSISELDDLSYLFKFMKANEMKSCLIFKVKIKKEDTLLLVYSKHNKSWNENDIVLTQYLSDYLTFKL